MLTAHDIPLKSDTLDFARFVNDRTTAGLQVMPLAFVLSFFPLEHTPRESNQKTNRSAFCLSDRNTDTNADEDNPVDEALH